MALTTENSYEEIINVIASLPVNPSRFATGNAQAHQVLTGVTFSNVDNVGIAGTMPNRGSVGTQTISTQNGTYTIPAGYHNGSGVVKATFGNLVSSNIKSGVNVGGVVGNLLSDVFQLEETIHTSGSVTLPRAVKVIGGYFGRTDAFVWIIGIGRFRADYSSPYHVWSASTSLTIVPNLSLSSDRKTVTFTGNGTLRLWY